MSRPLSRHPRRRRVLLAAALGIGLVAQPLMPPAAKAADNLVFVTGAFRRSIAVDDLAHLAKTGEARGLLVDVLAISRQKPAAVAKLLNESISLPVTLVSRLLNTRIGEAILARVARILYPMKAKEVGIPALRSAIVMGIVEGNGSLSAISFFRAYPTRELEVSIPALLSLMGKASSISELLRFFSESPLDGLRGDGGSPSARTP
ncbi:MAG: alpha/beta hydrolase [Cyanobacteriota bacterium]|nr:alpha/beta hydrolase [Cyanobacteriota bacterium]